MHGGALAEKEVVISESPVCTDYKHAGLEGSNCGMFEVNQFPERDLFIFRYPLVRRADSIS